MKHVSLILVLCLLLVGAACSKKTTLQNQNTSQINTSAATFPSDIYYRLPNRENPSAILKRVNGSLPTVTMSPVDFDIQSEQVVYATDDTISIVTPDGTTKTVTANGIYEMARPTLSPDGTRVAVQATRIQHPAGATGSPSELKIFVVDLVTGAATQISAESTTPNESPTWFNQSNRIAYGTFSPTDGVDIQIYDLDQQKIIMTLENAGFLHLAISPDDTRLLVPATMSIYDLTTGKKVDDLHQAVLTGIRQAGFTTVSPSLNNIGTYLYDGSWSPDGTKIVFDAVMVEHSEPHAVIFTMNADGTNVQAVTEQLEVNPDFSNNLNYSQVNPVWL